MTTKDEGGKAKIWKCGDCRLWMTKQCPREKNVDGWNRGPSMSGWTCEKFAKAQGEKP